MKFCCWGKLSMERIREKWTRSDEMNIFVPKSNIFVLISARFSAHPKWESSSSEAWDELKSRQKKKDYNEQLCVYVCIT